MILGASSTSVAALTAEDVTTRMNSDQRYSYVVGLVDMLAYETARAGEKDKSTCITAKFLKTGSEETWGKLREVMDQYPDKPPEVLVAVLARQLCK